MSTVVTNITALLAHFAPLLDYPSEQTLAAAVVCQQECWEVNKEAAQALGLFLDWISEVDLDEVEEVYTRTFYIAAVCTPYVSVHLFGEESFQRGELMARLMDAYIREGFDHGSELPDHLAVLLRFSTLLEGEELDELLQYCIAGPVKAMRAQLARTRNPYLHVFRALETLLKTIEGRPLC